MNAAHVDEDRNNKGKKERNEYKTVEENRGEMKRLK